MTFQFLDVGPMIDGELELVAPHERWIDAMLIAAAHPACHGDERADSMTRQSLLDFLRAAPLGQQNGAGRGARVPSYHFWMRVRPLPDGSGWNRPSVPMAGSISLRIGDSRDVELYYGHVGYNVLPAARGCRYAQRACQLLAPLARAHGMSRLWITCNPENFASRKTCERLGAELVDFVDVPPSNPLHARGEVRKCRYRWEISR
jgi:tagatose 1,6-diphosphate aldolase